MTSPSISEPQTALVTGASGQLGAALVNLLVRSGWEVAVTLRPTSSTSRLASVLDQITPIYTDLESFAEARERILTFHPQTIFHLAWYGATSKLRNTPEQLTTNVGSFLTLLQIARDAGVRRIVGIGSQAEYGPHNGVISEQTPTHPNSAYGMAKLAACHLGAEFCRLAGIGFTWLRLFSAYGPDDDPTHMLPILVRGLLAGTCPPLTAGTQPWEYLYVDDAAEAMLEAAASPAAIGTFNLSSGEPVTIRSVVEQIRDLVNPELPLALGQVTMSPEASWGIRADVSRLRTATGWVPRTPLNVGLARTVHWFQARCLESSR